jgi:molybdopterin-guanine dinucleotide biosynthesis protein A/nucleoside-triphosphatase THEP1
MNFAAVILAGGKSRRMGEDKSQLKIGAHSFAEILARELSGFVELYISVAEPGQPPVNLPQLADPFPNAGPLSGLLAGLEGCRAQAVLFVPCDTPFFTARDGKKLCAALTSEFDGVVAVSPSGRQYPLCAVYRKSAAEVFRRALEAGQNRVMQALAKLHIRFVELPDEILLNINSPEDYAAALKSLKKNIFLTGSRGAGKTRVIRRTLSALDATPVGYFTELSDCTSENRKLYINPASEKPCFDELHTAAVFDRDAARATDKFDTLGSAYVASPGELIIMDELGRLEEDSPRFRAAIIAALDSETPVLGVIRGGLPGWTAELAARPDVEIITVSDENRDELPERLARRLRLSGIKRYTDED